MVVCVCEAATNVRVQDSTCDICSIQFRSNAEPPLARNVRCVATLRDLPLRDAWPADARACRLERVAERLVGMSWADNVAVSYYCCTDSDRRAFEATQAAVQSGTTL